MVTQIIHSRLVFVRAQTKKVTHTLAHGLNIHTAACRTVQHVALITRQVDPATYFFVLFTTCCGHLRLK